MTTTVVVNNPRPASRTLDATTRLEDALTCRPVDHTLDLVELGPGLLEWGDDAVGAAVHSVQQSSLVVLASPTFKATYTGLLKLFLDQFAGGTGLAGVVAVPLMLGAAPDTRDRPGSAAQACARELGGTCALPGLYLLDSTYTEDPALDAYAERWAPVMAALTAHTS